MKNFEKTDLNTVRRQPQRGFYDSETIYKILDSLSLCHVGFVVDGRPLVIPMAYGRKADKLYLHGASSSRLIKSLEKEVQVCITVASLQGIVLARSAFHSSMNYHSVVAFGNGRLVRDSEKEEALKVITNHIWANRWQEVRPVNEIELKATGIIEVSIEQASAKIRTGPPHDDEEDYALPVWAGVIPIETRLGTPIPDERLEPGIEIPGSVRKQVSL